MDKIFKVNINNETIQNTNYRKVLYTAGNNMQLVTMSLKPGEEIGMEIHRDGAQFIRIERGYGAAIIGKGCYSEKHILKDDDSIIIPKGTWHNIINLSPMDDLKLYAIYSPPEHANGLVQKFKDNKKIHYSGTSPSKFEIKIIALIIAIILSYFIYRAI